MSRHYDADLLARFREGLVSARRATAVRRHLSGCATCTVIDSDLASVSAVLAGTHAPPMPDRLAERLQLAIANESAARAAGSPALAGGSSETTSAGPAVPAHVPGRPDLPERSRRRARRPRMPELSSSLLLRGLAATGAVVIIAGAGFLLASGQPAPNNTTAGSSPGRPRVAVPGENVAHTPNATSVEYHRNGELASAPATASEVNFTRSNLATEVRKQVASTAGTIAKAPATSAPSMAPGPGKTADLNGFSLPRLAACLTKVAAGRTVLLADVARYLGKPAAIIVIQSPRASVYDVVVVGLACSSSGSDIVSQSEVTKLPAG